MDPFSKVMKAELEKLVFMETLIKIFSKGWPELLCYKTVKYPMYRSPVIWISKSEPNFERLALFILSGLWGCCCAWALFGRVKTACQASFARDFEFKYISGLYKGHSRLPARACVLIRCLIKLELIRLESEKNKIFTLGLECREQWNYQALYNLQNMLSLQISAVVWGQQEDPWAAGRLLRHCCRLWAPPVGIWLLLWVWSSCFPLFAEKPGSHFSPGCWVVNLSKWFIPGC